MKYKKSEVVWGSPIGFFSPVIPTQNFVQSHDPKGHFWHPTSLSKFQSRISPRFGFKIPNPELQIGKIPGTEKPIGDPLVSPRMKSRGKVLLELLIQKQTSTETKNCTLKCLKWHYSTLRLLTNSCRLIGNRAFALFFRPHRGEFVIQGKKKKRWCPGFSPRGTWAQRELTDTLISKMVVELSKEYS